MKTSMFLAAVAAFGLALPSASAQSRVRDYRDSEPEAARQNERVPARVSPEKRRDDRRRDRDERRRDRDERRGRGDHRDHRDHRRDRDRPDFGRRFDAQLIVSSYWPRKGAGGTLVTIRGQNFSEGTKVMLGNDPIQPKEVTPTQITFRIPPKSSGTQPVRLQVPNSRRLYVVGGFEVSDVDPVAERKRIEAERRRAAKQRWKERRKELAKSREERRRRLAEREAELRETRERRRQERMAEVRARFRAAFLADPQTQAELALHAERIARLHRMLRLAEANADGNLVVRIEVALDRENQRHDTRMATLQSSFSMN